MNKRTLFPRVSALLVALLMGSSLLSCSKTGTPSSDGGADSAKNPATLTTLVSFTEGWVNNFSPVVLDAPAHLFGFLNEPLVIFDSYNNNKETMWLAEDIISEPDLKTLTIKVRQGVKWSDGDPVFG